ncbi:MAG: imidazolonepropionase [Chloroflexi bacterium]|nr:imidazolonepropionase [Chloroflexota bacterium]
MIIDLLIHSAAQLLTIPNGPQRGGALGELGLVEDGAVAILDGKIVAVGPTSDLRAQFTPRSTLDASRSVVMPGFVDPHTHLVWVGDRANEFEMRLAGATYMQIMNAGGGIMSTVRKTRAASVDQLAEETRPRLRRMLAHGATTVEIKTGYGLDTAAELRLWEAIARLQAEGPWDIVPTFLGAHAVPEEYKDREEAYVDLVVNEMLPAVSNQQSAISNTAYADVFCEEGAFTVEQSRRILERARVLGFGVKIHADEFVGLGGTRMGVELGAASADHVVFTPDEDIAALGKSNTVAVSLPPTPFGLAQKEYTPAKKFLDAGAILAIATDCNPGTGWCESMQFVVALACRYLKLTPAQALAAATVNAAFAIGLADRVGSLEVGKQADVLIIDAPDYRHIGYRFGTNLVKTVIKRGQVVAERE